MNTVFTADQTGRNTPKNLVVAFKEIKDDEVSKPSFSGGAGDASLSPSPVRRHTPGATLGAVRGPAAAPRRGLVYRTGGAGV